MTSRITGYGVGSSKVALAPVPAKNNGVPSSSTAYDFGQLVYDTATQTWYLYSGGTTYVTIGGAASQLNTLTDTGNTTVTPSGGNIKLSGTANQVTVTAGSSTLTWSLPSTLIAPGSIASTSTITAGTGLTATTGNITATAGNLVATVGSLHLNGVASTVLINASTSTSACVGFVTLAGASTTTLTSSAITSNSIILFSLQALGTVMSSAITYTTTTGSATITPADSSDTSVYGYLIIN